jgi:hypothetical protein
MKVIKINWAYQHHSKSTMYGVLKRKTQETIDETVFLKKLHSKEDDNTSVETSELTDMPFIRENKENQDFYASPTKTPDALSSDDTQTTSKTPPKKKTNLNSSHEDMARRYNKDPSQFVDNYKLLKFKDAKYGIGDAVLIRNQDNIADDFICKLLKIIRLKSKE